MGCSVKCESCMHFNRRFKFCGVFGCENFSKYLKRGREAVVTGVNCNCVMVKEKEMDYRFNWKVKNITIDHEMGGMPEFTVEIKGCPKSYIMNTPEDMARLTNVIESRLNEIHRHTVSRDPYRNIRIKNVIFNNPATIVFWEDGTKTVVKAQDEFFDPEKGLAMAITKKVLGNHGNYFNEIKKWTNAITVIEVN